MSTQKEQFLTPVGRLVQGHPMDKQTKDNQGNLLTIKSGPQAGQPTQKYFCALAFRKDDPAFAAFYAQLAKVARQSFPQQFDAAGNCINPRFSWKLVDGDSTVPDEGGRAPASKEGFPGHWVVRFSSSFPPRCFNAGMYEPHQQIADPNVIRRGYYGRVSGTIEGNANAQKPGLYVNLSMFELSAQGPEIVSGPDAAATFGASPVAALPAGAMALPRPGAVPAMPGMPAAMPGAQPAMPGMPAAGGMPAMPQPVMPGAQPAVPGMPAMPQPVMPNPAFAAGPAAMPGMPAAMPQPGAMPAMPGMPAAMPQPPAGPALTPAGVATGYSLAQFQAAGWTEAALRQAGYIL
jgi:hypothetical protein